MMKNQGLMKIGDFARAADTNLRTLRYYEELGLLEPSKRSEGGFRYFRIVDLHRVRMIQNLQGLGMSLEEIGELISHRKVKGDHSATMTQVKQSLNRQAHLIEERQDQLADLHAAIDEALLKLKTCVTCEHTPCEDNNWCEPCGLTERSLPRALSALF
jgi:DNA-binding transcriptional MerR regulator